MKKDLDLAPLKRIIDYAIVLMARRKDYRS
jgi:hypothetical protein